MISISMQRRPCQQAEAPTLVMLHGWGYNKTAWPESWLQALAANFDLWLVDLPGHGEDSCQDDTDEDLQILDTWLQALGAQLPSHYCLLGWSLGGQVAWRLGQLQPERVISVVTLASNPSFVQRKDWPHAMSEPVLQQFTTAFSGAANKTLQRFCALQAQGSSQASAINKHLRTQVDCRASLAMGLDWLAKLNARAAWQSLSMPALLLLAEEDALVPVAVADDLKHLARPSQSVETLPGCHAFVWQYGFTDQDLLLSRISDFLEPFYV